MSVGNPYANLFIRTIYAQLVNCTAFYQNLSTSAIISGIQGNYLFLNAEQTDSVIVFYHIQYVNGTLALSFNYLIFYVFQC